MVGNDDRVGCNHVRRDLISADDADHDRHHRTNGRRRRDWSFIEPTSATDANSNTLALKPSMSNIIQFPSSFGSGDSAGGQNPDAPVRFFATPQQMLEIS